MIRRWTLYLAPATLLMVALQPASAFAGEEGKRLYSVHCLACHGTTGHGDGPMKDQLDMTIPDLTTLATTNDGEFPTDEVHQIIDGRYETPAHGTRNMPVWGFTFQSNGRDTDQESEIQEMVGALTRYVESLQVSSETQPETDEPEE